MRDPEELFAALARSDFRRRCRLGKRERDYLRRKGLETVLEHARTFIETRLAPAEPDNDGRQTPWRNHPVFVAQHATGSCCRGCLWRWHQIPKGRALKPAERRYVVAVIRCWLLRQAPEMAPNAGEDAAGAHRQE